MREANFVPKERYYSRELHELEKEHLWSRVWQMAARLEEIPNAGDFVEYEVAGRSILIVRQRDGSVKALHNACRHRATELAKGSGRFPGGQLVCPFHGWRWNLDGSSSFVFMDSAFEPECLKKEDIRLRECRVEIWSGHVWINMDPEARPLREALSPVADMLDAVGVGNMRVKWWKQVILNANWKMAQEAFFEGYHTLQTHPQLMMGGGEEAGAMMSEAIEYTVFGNGHARFQGGAFENEGWTADADTFIESGRLLAQGQDAMTLDGDIRVFEGLRNRTDIDLSDFPAAAISALYEYAEGAGIPMAPLTDAMRLWGGDIFLFPNYLMLPMYGNALCYRSRPYQDDPEKCVFDVWSLTTYPEGQEPERAELLGVFDKDDTEHWGLIPRQDFSNIEGQQRGLHSQDFDGLRLSSKYEKSIANMHEEMDRVIASNM
ncbi:aromatic ring-hydroxylating dioxygenase subunit alpha [Actinomadura sp. KC345]|nr:aromatic ring-hydroxylating dioxygenase subunit alpha [Actinomadura sp. KC345]